MEREKSGGFRELQRRDDRLHPCRKLDLRRRLTVTRITVRGYNLGFNTEVTS